MKAVMYHYVHTDDDSPPFGYYHLDPGDFGAQLDYLEREFGILDRDEFLRAVREGRPPDDTGVVLTFDDGLAGHYEHVLPRLESRDLWGVFYVPTGPYRDGIALDVHRIHSLLGACGGDTVAEQLETVIDESMVDDEYVQRFGDAVYRPQDNESGTERAKRLINYYLDDRYRSSVLETLETRLLDGRSYHEDLYMTSKQLAALRDAGMLIGSHTDTHPVMSTLSADDQRREIESSFAFLADLLGKLPVKTFCHPYGGSHSYTDETLDLLEAVGCLFSFDVDARDLTTADLRSRPNRLPRYDCNDFRHGDATSSLG